MPPHTAAHPETPTGPHPTPKDLTVNKILAGAGAAATTAVLGSYFGAAGTVAGAALGSVASTVAATLYQRSLDRTQATLVARIRPVTREPSADDDTVQLRLEPAARPRRRWVLWAAATAVVFVLGLLAVTGVEWIKGSTITSGDTGTSIGRVIGADPGDSTATQDPPSDPERTHRSTADPTSAPESSATPSSTEAPDPTRVETTPTPTSAATPSTPG